MEMKLTVFGMENYLSKYDDSLFKDITFPDGLDKNTFINALMMEYGEFETLYADVNFMKFSTKAWYDKWKHTFEKWNTALNSEYNPIENYDRYEEGEDVLEDEYDSTMTKDQLRKGSADTDFINLKDTKSGSITDKPNNWKTEHDAQDYTTSANNSTKEVHEAGVSAYDASSYSNQARTTVTVTPVDGSTPSSETEVEYSSSPETTKLTGTYEVEDTTANTRTGTVTQENDIGKIEDAHEGTDTHTTTYGKHIHGNIGVTTTQQMISSEINLYRNYNIYQHMADMYASELLILVL